MRRYALQLAQPSQPSQPSPSQPSQPAQPVPSSLPAPQEPESYGWDRGDVLSRLSERGNDVQVVYENKTRVMQNRLAEIDARIVDAWNEQSLGAVKDLIDANAHFLASVDQELTEHWSQLSTSLIVHRLFLEDLSRVTIFHHSIMKEVITYVLRGAITGNHIGKIYNPDVKAMRELLMIARRAERWDALISCMTFHMRKEKDARSLERAHLYFLRRILLAEADEWMWK